MADFPREFEAVWLKEIERRIAADRPLNTMEMMVELRQHLPSGFKPSDVSGALLYGATPSVVGLQAIGDRTGLLPDVEKAIRFIQGRLIDHPSLERITAADLADALHVSLKRAERILFLLTSLRRFTSGSSGTHDGCSDIRLGREDILAEYLRFTDFGSLLADQSAASLPPSPPSPIVTAPMSDRSASRETAFVLMNMDPRDDSLTDICNAIKGECSAFGVEALRIDDVEHQDRITDRILEMIQTSQFIIADLTGERPNVYYEVGYAHAIGKRPILFRKKDTRLHFDLSVHNVPEYKNMTELKALLHRRLEAILGRVARSDGAPRLGSADSA